MPDRNLPNGDKPTTIIWDRPKLKEFKLHLDMAILAGQKEFEFEGHLFLVSYAWYLAMYLDEHLRKEEGDKS